LAWLVVAAAEGCDRPEGARRSCVRWGPADLSQPAAAATGWGLCRAWGLACDGVSPDNLI